MTASHIGSYERGAIRWPNADYRAALRAVFGMTDRALGLYVDRPDRDASDHHGDSTENSPNPVVAGVEAGDHIRGSHDVESVEVGSVDMRRRTLMMWGLTSTVAGVLDGDDIDRLARVRSGSLKLDAATIGHIEAVIHHCRRQEDTLGPDAVLDTVSAQGRLVRAVLPSASDELRERLLSLYANICRSIGWMLFNLNDFAGADHYFAQARTAAHQAENDALTSFILANWSQLATWRGDAREGVEHALGALAWGQRAGSSLLVSYACDVGARAYATIVRHSSSRASDYTACTRFLDQAGTDLATAGDTDSGRTLLHFYDEGLHKSTRTLCLLDLGEITQALPLAQEAVDRIDPAFVRNLAFARLDLARAHIEARQTRDIDAASDEIAKAAQLSGHNTSPRLISSVLEARSALDPWSTSAAVRQLDHQLAALTSA